LSDYEPVFPDMLYGGMASQRRITEWCEDHYPSSTIEQAFTALVEEVMELGVELERAGYRLDLDSVLTASRISYEKAASGKASSPKEEIGDIAINLAHLASKLHCIVQVCANDKMTKLKHRSVDESQRLARKHGFGLDV